MTAQTQPAQPKALRLAAWLNEGAWHSITLGDVNAAGRELRRLHAESESQAARIAQLKAENQQLMSALAECRDAFPIPSPGTDLECEWGAAMGDPESVPEYVKAQLRSRPALSDEQKNAIIEEWIASRIQGDPT